MRCDLNMSSYCMCLCCLCVQSMQTQTFNRKSAGDTKREQYSPIITATIAMHLYETISYIHRLHAYLMCSKTNKTKWNQFSC